MGQPGPQDVARGVFVCRGAMRASLAAKFRLRDAVRARGIPTALTPVGGVPGVDLDPNPPSLFRFGAQYRDELAPSSVTDRSAEPGLRPSSIWKVLHRVGGFRDRFGPAQHIRDLQVLHDDQVVSCGEFAGLFVVKVPALVGYLAMAGGHCFPPQTSIFRSWLRALKPLLRCGQSIRRGARPPGIVDALSVAGSGKANNADVDADLTAGHGQQTGWDVIAGQHQHPASPLSLDPDRLHPAGHLAVEINLDLTDALQIHPTTLGQPAGAVAIFGPLHAFEPGLAFEPRIPRCLPRLHPAEEPGECPVQPSQRRLLTGERPDRLIGAHRSDFSQLRRLIPVPDPSLSRVGPGIPTLLQRRVVKLAVRGYTRRQRHMLARCGPQPKHIRPPHSRSTPLEGKRRLNMSAIYATPPTKPMRPHCSPAAMRTLAKGAGPLGAP